MADDNGQSIWLRPEHPDHPTPGPQRGYSRAQIVSAAIGIADQEGIDAASMRRIASEIGCGTMTLYQYVPNRDDLIELVIDKVTGEMELPAAPSGDWRADLTQVACAMRALWLRHPWLVTRVPGHPVWGPNSLRLQEFELTVFDAFDLSVDELVTLLCLFNGYVEAYGRTEVGWQVEARRTGVSPEEWMRRTEPFTRHLIRSGIYPRFARTLTENTASQMEPDKRFRYGLDRVLDSIEAGLMREG
jgi:AcrR family transcriptional regulator